jgi:AcrR family transcriptional regulator
LDNSKEDKVKGRKRRITSALKVLLQKHVYSQISIQEIADEAGYSKGGVLHYFPTKDDIYIELINDMYAELDNNHRRILKIDLKSEEMAPISSLLGVESFVLDRANIIILINIILYSFENETLRQMMNKFFENHRLFYENIIKENTKDEVNPDGLDEKTAARIIQAVVFFIGLIEEFDPIDLDYIKIVKYVSNLLRSKNPVSNDKSG